MVMDAVYTEPVSGDSGLFYVFFRFFAVFWAIFAPNIPILGGYSVI